VLKKAQRAWCLYDWANSAFAATIMATLYPPFFRELAQAAGRSGAEATALWGYVTAGGLLLVAIAAPILGAVADVVGARKKLLALFAGLGILLTGLFATVGAEAWRTAALLFVGANFGFAASIIFYESLLPSLAQGKDMDRLSALAYGWGYAGGGLLLIINLLWVMHPDWFGMPDAGFAVRASFISVAVWWGVFTLPLLRHVPEPPVIREPGEELGGPVLTLGFRRLRRTFAALGEHRQLLLFLAAYWIYNDGIGTIVKMATAYGSEIGIGMSDLIGALVLTQLIGVPCSLLFGRLALRTSTRKAILLALGVYLLISIGGFFMSTPLHFYLLAGAVGTVQGGAQSLSRSLFAAMVPRQRSAEFFGFFSSSGKLAGVAGPLVFGLVSQLTGTGRLGILSLIVFFAVGGALLTRVDVAAGVRAARRSEERAGYTA
jgi:UMF1 family MFS transporter